MAEPELGGIWRNLPHEPTRAEEAREWSALDREAEDARAQYIHDLRNPSLSDIAERREELRASDMDYDQITNQMSWERQQNISFADRLDHDGREDQDRQSGVNYDRVMDQQLDRIQTRWGELERNGVDPDLIENIIGQEFPKSSYGRDYDFSGILAQDEKMREAQVRAEKVRPDFHQQARAEHDIALASPQRFPLTGDGEHAERITRDGFQVGDGADLSAMRYQDYWRARLATPLTDQQRQAERALSQLTAESKFRQSETVNDGRQAKLSI